MTTDRRDVDRTPAVVPGDWRLFGLLSALYFAQGLPSGLIAKALPPLLREQGVSLSVIGFTSALALPWALKFLWAPFVDRYGSRKRWLLVLTGLTMSLMLLVASRDFAAWTAALPWLLAVLFLMNLVSATQDIATDGHAVSSLKPEWRGLGNSIQVVGYKVGMVVGGGALLWLTARYGWQASYAGLACLMLLVIAPVAFMKEPPAAERAATHTEWQGVRGYLRVFHDFVMRPGLGWWLLTVALYKFGDSLGSRMTGPLLSDRGYSLADIGVITGSAGATTGILGAFVGGATLLRLGRRQALLGFGVLQALGLAAYLFVVAGLTDLYALAAIVHFEQFADGLSTVALFTIMMDRCRPQSPGTDYSLQASLQVLVTGIAATLGGLYAQRFGYSAVFATAATLTLLALMPAMLSFREAGAGTWRD
jgi:MFS transporter, PAT family, beta-lactamase induction signal transducer AmpG